MCNTLCNCIMILCIFLANVNTIFSQSFIDNLDDLYIKNDSTNLWGNIYKTFFNRDSFNKSYAIVIGIGNYKSDWNDIESAYFDAINMKNYLINDAGFDYVHILTNSMATKHKINKIMEETFPEILTNNDRFLFYFSGHGTERILRDIPYGYLVLQNCREFSYGEMITMQDIERWDNLIQHTKQVLFMLDCCFSGLAGKQLKSPLATKKIERLSQYSHHLITSGTANEEAVASVKNWGGSLFTSSFLRAVKGNADLTSEDYAKDGIISLKELMKYIGDCIDDETLKLKSRNKLSKGIRMSPQISDLKNNEGEFFFISKGFKNQRVGNDFGNKLAKGWPINSKGRVIDYDYFKINYSNISTLIRQDSTSLINWMNRNLAFEINDTIKTFMFYEHGDIISKAIFRLYDEIYELFLLYKKKDKNIHMGLIKDSSFYMLIDYPTSSHSLLTFKGTVQKNKEGIISSINTWHEKLTQEEEKEFYQLFLSWWSTVQKLNY